MNTRQRGLVAGILMATLVISPLAEAKRAGGGRSHGMTRSVTPSQPHQQQPTSSYQAPPAPAPQPQKSGSNLGKMVAAGAAGAAVGALATHALANNDHNGTATSAAQQNVQAEKKSGIPGWIWLILLGGIGFFIYRKMSAKKSAAANPYVSNQGSAPFTGQPSSTNDSTNIFGQNVNGNSNNQNVGGAYTSNGGQLPDGTEPAAFLRIARQRFNHIQSMNSSSNVEEIRRYLTPELYNSMYQDIMANREQDVAEFNNLNAMVAGSANENGQYIVSVRFTGTVSEDLNSVPQPFTEVWHFVKPVGSQQDWLVAGIQVEN
ncbi:Tim44 domain-containing protein [Acinetobacter sp. ANC 4641]|uniref:Tim44 domain-containing protein n=1 Tax=Acinetobacter sp. ANC 4641 TaxID=2529847 RepID=UPI00103D15AD|nr:Tim44-like domain-containing protein [Acinetobacter sp. ANC 4641]TCB11409.1 Tim44 domain-containing protein [Acinetobacter sp. ANC 4641]